MGFAAVGQEHYTRKRAQMALKRLLSLSRGDIPYPYRAVAGS
jgi:hypothetical protein